MTSQQQSQLHNLNQRLLRRQEETHPNEQKPLPTPKNAAIVEQITIVRACKAKLWQKMQCQKSRGLPDKNLSLPPTTAIDTNHNGKAR